MWFQNGSIIFIRVQLKKKEYINVSGVLIRTWQNEITGVSHLQYKLKFVYITDLNTVETFKQR